ncbi:MAG: transglutaminase family protein [Planctomycetes bacterium]|nr:transglutaminase family protein [Planctomycetota bacterium]
MQQIPDRSTIASVVSFLADDSPGVVRTCRAHLLRWGEACRSALAEAARSSNATMRVEARSLLRSLDLRIWTEQVAELGRRAADRSGESVLEQGLALIQFLGRPLSDPKALRREIELISAGAETVVAGHTPMTAARKLAAYLGQIEGFRGCDSSYYRPENLFLDCVLERRRGLPIALAALYVLVARRIGLDAAAVRLPDDYYLVRVHGRRATLLDPFHGGRTVTKADAVRYLRQVGAAKPVSSQLADVDDVQLLLGMMSTLGRVYEHREDREFREALRRAQRALSLG